MNNIKCQVPNHQERKITSVCLNKDCQDKRLCCHICIIGQLHSGHADKTIEIEQLNEFIKKESTEQVKFPQSYCYGQLQVIKGLEQMRDLTESLQKVIKEKLELAKQQNLKEFLKQSSSVQQGIEYWNTLIEGILKYVQADNYLIIPKQQNEGQLSEKEGKQFQIIRKSEQSIQEIIESINLLGQEKQLQFSKKPIELAGHQNCVNQVAISQDGSLIASGSEDKTVKLWNVKSKTLLQTIENDLYVYRVAISSKNEYLAFRNTDKSIKLFDLKSNKVLWTQKEHTNTIRCIIFSQDTQYLLSGGRDQRLIIWSVINNTKIHCFETDGSIESIVMSRDNKLVACICNRGGTIYIWDFQTKTKLIQENKTHSQGYGLCTSADSSMYVSSGDEGLIKIWKLNESLNNQKSLTLTKSIQAASNCIEKVLLTPDDVYIISICNEEGQIRIHERETGKLVQVLESGTKSTDYAYISISNDMNTLVSSNNQDKTLRIWTRE